MPIRGYDLAAEHDITLTFTDDTWAMTFDPPLPGVSERGAAAIISGRYDLLSDTRMLLVFERPIETSLVTDYLVGPTALIFELKGHRWLTARRM